MIERLSEFYSPQEVARAIAREFQTSRSARRVVHCGGSHGPGEELDPDLQELFRERRRAFLENVEQIPVSHRIVRLRALQDTLDVLLPLAAPEGDAKPDLAAVDRIATLLDLARRETERVGPAVSITNTVAAGVTVNLDLPEEYRNELAQRARSAAAAEAEPVSTLRSRHPDSSRASALPVPPTR